MHQPCMLAHHSSSRPACDSSSKHKSTMSTTATGIGSVQLCLSCQHLDWPQLPLSDDPGGFINLHFHFHPRDPPHKTFGLLEESAAEGCTFCQLFWCCIMNSTEVAKRQITELPLDASLWMHLHTNKHLFQLRMGAEWASIRCYSLIYFTPLQADERDRTEILELQQVKPFYPGTILNDLEELVKDTILPWMKDCCEHRENHSHYGLSGHATVFPTRLIDVGEAEDDLIRLVETDQDSVTNPYLILSYCWGQGNESARTTRENLESRLCRFSMTTLPKTIRDAIILTRMMGFQYLWVDAMCIVQASNDDPGDFKLEAMKMRDYYANAQCCISASLARDSSEGFLTGRPLGRFPVPRVVALKLASSTSSQSALFKGEQPAYLRAHVLKATPLMERGWYIQELMLSRRILHWTLHGVHLECESSLLIEGRAQRFRRGRPEEPQPREVLALPDDIILDYYGWYTLINTYSMKQLSYESDRMHAIHGIASLLVQRCGAEYFHGVFRSSIAQGLAWRSWTEDSEPNLVTRPPKHIDTQFPTWSWGSNCPVLISKIKDAQRSNQDDTLYDSLLEGLDEGISILWLVLGLSIDDWYMGLLLQRKGETLYQRYGFLKIKWNPDDVEDRFDTLEEIILE